LSTAIALLDLFDREDHASFSFYAAPMRPQCLGRS
jgi:hypothetical protein